MQRQQHWFPGHLRSADFSAAILCCRFFTWAGTLLIHLTRARKEEAELSLIPPWRKQSVRASTIWEFSAKTHLPCGSKEWALWHRLLIPDYLIPQTLHRRIQKYLWMKVQIICINFGPRKVSHLFFPGSWEVPLYAAETPRWVLGKWLGEKVMLKMSWFRAQWETSIDLTEVWIRGCKSMVQIWI